MQDSTLKRFGVSMDEKLLKEFDELIRQKGYENRSEAVRDLVRSALIQESVEHDDYLAAGSVLLFYDHHKRDLLHELTLIQHRMHDLILATTHFHLDHHNCLELIVLRGKARDLRHFSDQLISLKGVKYGKFTAAPLQDI